MNKITQLLQQGTIQRRSYLVFLICWVYMFIDIDRRAYITTDADYLPLIFIIPVLLLVLQILFNNRILWGIIWGCIVTFTLWTFFKMFMNIMVDHHREYGHSIVWNAETIFQYVLIIGSFLIFNWFIFKLKPVKK